MLKRMIIAAAAVAFSAAVAFAQTAYPTPDGKNSSPGSIAYCLNTAGHALPCQHGSAFAVVSSSSGNKAAAVATTTLAASTTQLTFICGFSATGAGATAATAVNATITGVIGGTMTYVFAVPAGVDVPAQGLSVQFYPCIPTTAINTAIIVSMPSLGTGNAHAAMVAWGYQQ